MIYCLHRFSHFHAYSLCAMVMILMSLPGLALGQVAPGPKPPIIPPQVETVDKQAGPITQATAAPTTEWMLHRSVDGAIPSAAEQRMMWLMNRARQNPTAEGVYLAESQVNDIKLGRDYFNVDLTKLKSDFAALAAMPPAAFDIRLYDASELHSLDLIARDAQDHTGQIEKVQNSGFTCNGGRFSVFSYAGSALNAHAALNIDWGGTAATGGMQDPPGHRYAIMGVFDVTLSNVGLAMVTESNSTTNVGPEVFSGAYCHAGGSDHNRFIVGTAWNDLDKDGEYDEGEGLGGVTVTPDSGDYYAVTGAAGGYAIPISSAGTYTVLFSGSGLPGGSVQKAINVNADSVLLDVNAGEETGRPLLMRRSTDQRWYAYLLSGSTVVAKGFMDLTRSPAYSVVSRSDFDGDGEADLLVRDLTPGKDENGRWVLYTFSGNTVTSQGFMDAGLTRNADWQVVSTEDFDGDAKADLLLRNAVDGRWLLYLLDSHLVKSQAVMAMSTDLTDTIQGIADFNGDGRSDVLLRRADGSWLAYLLNGLAAPEQAAPAMTANLAFSVQALGDFNGDGRTDVLMRRTDGRWFMYMPNDSDTLASGSPAMTEATDFQLAEVADFSGDGKDDVLLRRQTDGRWFLYTMDGLAIVSSGAPDMTRNLEFSIVSTQDFTGDGKADVLMRRSDGRWVLYGMDGAVVATKGIPDMTRNVAWSPYPQ